MSSILTNNGAMVALQTLKGINQSMAKTQSEISTGKSVSNAKDNAAVWAISKVMEADVQSFKAISDGLSFGESTLGVARDAAESVTDLLTEIKTRIVSAQQASTQDRAKMQTDIDGLTDQIATAVGSAQLNGLNLINGSSTEPVKILASLERTGSGVTATHIEVERQDLSLSNTAVAAVFGATAVTDTSIMSNGGVIAGTAATVADATTQAINIASVADGNSYRLVLDDSAGANSVGQRTFEYVANTQDSAESVAANLTNQVAAFLAATGDTNYSVVRDGDDIRLTNASGAAMVVTAETATAGTSGTSSGGLGALNNMDVRSDSGATAALNSIETLIQTSINAAASLGSAQKRIGLQNDFVGRLTDMMNVGIGSLVDANMEETSARLQALQVQQQLGVESLSIANQAPQALLSLFR